MIDKKTVKQTYLQNPPLAGVYLINSKQTNRYLLAHSQNPQGALQRHQFELRLKLHRNHDLQQDWNTYGVEEFTLVILEQINPNEKLPEQALSILIKKWETTIELTHGQQY